MYELFFRKREINKKKAAQLLREGKRGEARECLQRCIDISPDMALNLMNVSTSLYMSWLIRVLLKSTETGSLSFEGLSSERRGLYCGSL